ncbi:MAG: hypothetical protein ABI863_07140 [Ginsengibacter sp.]
MMKNENIIFSEAVKNEIFVYHIAVGEDANRGVPPWPVVPPATTLYLYEILQIIFKQPLRLRGLYLCVLGAGSDTSIFIWNLSFYRQQFFEER